MTGHTDELSGERILNPQQPNRKRIAAFAVICLMVLGFVGNLLLVNFNKSEEKQAKPSNANIATTFSIERGRSHVGRTFEFEDNTPADTPPQPVVVVVPEADTPPPPPSNKKEAFVPTKKVITLDKSAASFNGSNGSGEQGGLSVVSQTANVTQTTDSFNLFSSAQQDTSGLANQLSTTRSNNAIAGVLYNRDYLLAKGAYIDCVLNTGMSSDVAGMTKCTLTRNIYSDNGTTLLLERGAEVTGEYRANLSQGQSRLFVIWDRVKTPRGVVIDIASTATGSLGQGGVDGYVETHFWKRFGGAMMLSLVDDFATYVATNGGKNVKNGDNFKRSSDAAQNMASEALKHTINIPPTFYKNHGERVGIFVARDLDFSTVYQLQAIQ
ncbi:type IV secretion system protein VirB10 [Candidatus Enterovibrio escicola]|uniref:type IV secretion system protein VirB10 n=1 Tax=Candidatus Enterovibrio escicola TaxID=1927127 RepID=UPI0012382B07|nr:type IV secretion system protein VirB10 [Candidatus Enterovibrio escacola]